MKQASSSFAAAILACFFISSMCSGQTPETVATRVPLLQDWSTNTLMYPGELSKSLTPEQMSDPRFLNAWLQRNPAWAQARSLALQRAEQGGEQSGSTLVSAKPAPGSKHSKTDWAMSLGPTAGMPVGESPTKFSFDVTKPPSCANDFVVFVIGANAVAGTQANIVAFNNLYSGPGASFCNLLNPTVLWSYAAGTGKVDLSPVLSLDGTKVAFIERRNTRSRFDVLTWVAGQGIDATTGSVAPGAAGSSLSVLDYTNIPGNLNCPVSNSTSSNASPFVDYTNDVAYVAADNGRLYRINGVFNSTPAVAYCITVNNNKTLTSPVWDSISGKVYVSDGSKLYAFTPGANSFMPAGAPVTVASLTTDAVVISPVVDVTNGWVYVFGSSDVTGTHAVAAQVKADLSSSSIGFIGDATTNYILYGQVDNHYWNNGPLPTSTLYACGTQIGSGGANPSLYAFNFSNAGVMNPVPIMSDNRGVTTGAAAGACSPLVEFFDGIHDRIFVGVTGTNRVTMWGIGSQLTGASLPSATAIGQTGGTSSFCRDNFSAVPQASSIYFGTLGAGTTQCGNGNFCAVKLTQGTLQ